MELTKQGKVQRRNNIGQGRHTIPKALKKVGITATISPKIIEKLGKYLADSGENKSNLIEELLKVYLKRHNY